MTKPIDIKSIVSPDQLAVQIAMYWHNWDTARAKKKRDWEELSSFVFATDTKTTTVGQNTPWKNSTTIPKLAQIRDNLKANLLGSLFPNSEWLEWEAGSRSSNTIAKRQAAIAYTRAKLREGGFEETASRLLDDYIDYGNAFAVVDYEREVVKLPDGSEISGFIGGKLSRISPYDIVFDPTATSFRDSPKILRSVKTLGQLKKAVINDPSKSYQAGVFDKAINTRKTLQGMLSNEKNTAFIKDGFGGIMDYWDSDMVELLEFYGDIYNTETGELLENRIITVIDRSYIIRNVPWESWLGEAPIYHAGWRNRPDNLWAMGPLDNLVGMQYMVDKLQNSKADILEQIIQPTTVIIGDVTEPDRAGPGAKYYVGDTGDVRYLAPDASALINNQEIAILLQSMEEMAGAPREKMGLRSPGEKTKFEVQVLDNAGSRVFLKQAAQLEMQLFEPAINMILEMGRRLMDSAEEVRLRDEEFDTDIFLSISKEDLASKGKLRPVGARHFAEKANRIQEIIQVFNSAIANDPEVKVHLSGKKKAEMVEELFNLKKYGLYQPFVQVAEQMELQRMSQSAQDMVDVEAMTPSAQEGLL